MGYKVHRDIQGALGPEIKGLPRFVAAMIAIDADEETGETSISLKTLAKRTGAEESSIRDALKRLSAQGWEFRVPMGSDKNGKPLFAIPGMRLCFRVPTVRGEIRARAKDQGRVTTRPSGADKGRVTTPTVAVVTPTVEVPARPSLLPSTASTAPESSIASLSPSVPRTSAQDEREVIMIKLATQHDASVQEIESAWQMASNPDFPGADEYRTHFRDWFEAWIKKPDEVAQDLANYRDKLHWNAENERLRALPQYECTVCHRPFQRGVVATLCRDCGEAA